MAESTKLNITGILIGPSALTTQKYTKLQFCIYSNGHIGIDQLVDDKYKSYMVGPMVGPEQITTQAKASFRQLNQMANLCLDFSSQDRSKLTDLVIELATSTVEYLTDPDDASALNVIFYKP